MPAPQILRRSCTVAPLAIRLVSVNPPLRYFLTHQLPTALSLSSVVGTPVALSFALSDTVMVNGQGAVEGVQHFACCLAMPAIWEKYRQ